VYAELRGNTELALTPDTVQSLHCAGCKSNVPDIFWSGVAVTRLYAAQVYKLFYWVDRVTIHCYWQWRRTRTKILDRDVNFREFYFSIREFQISRLVEYSKLTRHSAWTTYLIRECCNTVGLDITPCNCGWAAAPGKWSDRLCGGVKLQSSPVSLMYSCLVIPDRQTAVIPDSSHAVAVIAQQ